MSLATHPSSDATSRPEDLIGWSKSEDPGIRWNVAKNPGTPREVLINFAVNETNTEVLMGLATNPHTDFEVVELMLENDSVVRISSMIGYLGYKRPMNQNLAIKLFSKGCRVLEIAPFLDIEHLRKWQALNRSRVKYFDDLINQKKEELIELWIE